MHYNYIHWRIFRNFAMNNEITEDGRMHVFIDVHDLDDDMTASCPAALTAVMNSCHDIVALFRLKINFELVTHIREKGISYCATVTVAIIKLLRSLRYTTQALEGMCFVFDGWHVVSPKRMFTWN